MQAYPVPSTRFSPYGPDLRSRIIYKRVAERKTVQTTAAECQVSESTVKRTVRLQGQPYLLGRRGCVHSGRKLQPEIWDLLLANDEGMLLAELGERIQGHTGVEFSVPELFQPTAVTHAARRKDCVWSKGASKAASALNRQYSTVLYSTLASGA